MIMRPVTRSARSPKPKSKDAVPAGSGRDHAAFPDNASDDSSYFFLPEAKVGCHAEAFWLGAAAITLIFSFLGFLASRFPLCWRLAMSISLFDDDTGIRSKPD